MNRQPRGVERAICRSAKNFQIVYYKITKFRYGLFRLRLGDYPTALRIYTPIRGDTITPKIDD
jgi:hypothetical protein